MSGFFPTPNKWFKKLLEKNFKTITVNEANTSKKDYRTEEDVIHVKYKKKMGKKKKHIVYYQLEKKMKKQLKKKN